MATRHFLSFADLSRDELHELIRRASELKSKQNRREPHETLKGRVLGMLFEKSSTRTRISFESGMSHLGGSSIFLSPRDCHLGRGEPIEDTSRVLSSMVDVVVVRTFEHEKLERFTKHSRVPVINGLTDRFHPCQLLADIQTFVEHRGPIAGAKVVWVGDGNNMCNSYIEATTGFDFHLQVACPVGYEPDPSLVAAAGDRVTIDHDPQRAVKGANLIATDVWVSMGQEEERLQRCNDFAGFQVNEALVAVADSDVLVMHCLPAHRGEEISATMLDSPQSVVWDEAENRLHAQKALLEFLVA